jgi:Flp pilus assembly protein CpaB
VVGGLLVAASAVGLYASYARAAGGPRHAYVVLAHSVPVGTELRASDLRLAPMDLPPAVQRRVFDSRAELVGATVIGPLDAGELVQQASVVRTHGVPGGQELTIPIERSRMLPGLKPGERVDVLVTYGSGTDAFTFAAARQALVVSVERSRSSFGDSTSSALLTVALDRPADSVAVAHASRAGQLTLVRSTAARGPAEPSLYRPNPPAAP